LLKEKEGGGEKGEKEEARLESNNHYF